MAGGAAASGLAPPAPFADGSVFPLRGTPCRIRSRRGRGIVTLERRANGRFCWCPGRAGISGAAGYRLAAGARRAATSSARSPATPRRSAARRSALRISDPKSRWGSCSAAGVLTFSWRLVLAPPTVLDYLAAHEVAHLKEMHHGPKFWALVEKLDPDYEAARAWLNKGGVALSAVGREA